MHDKEQYHFLFQGYGKPHLIYKILDTDRLYYLMSETDPKYYEIKDVIPKPTPSDRIMIQFITSASSSTDIDIPTTYVLTLDDDNLIKINNVGGRQQSALWQKFIRDNTAHYQKLKSLEYNKGGKRKSRKSKKHKKSKKHTKIKKTKRRRPTKKRR